jgi:hypothetical protein
MRNSVSMPPWAIRDAVYTWVSDEAARAAAEVVDRDNVVAATSAAAAAASAAVLALMDMPA